MPDVVKVEYKQTGESTRINPYGMREMQERAFEFRDANIFFLNLPLPLEIQSTYVSWIR